MTNLSTETANGRVRSAADGPLAIETFGLVKRFPKQPGWRNLISAGGEKLALRGVDLAVRRGETFGLLGPNGAGKTTLIKILGTLISPTSGIVRVAGLDVVRQELEVRKRIGLIYGDERSFNWRLSLEENLRFYATIYGVRGAEARRRIDELTELVGLRDAARIRMHYFSAGMKQRAAIARGLVSDPEVIFLDEPTNSVDPIGAHAIRELIRERIVAGGRRTVLLTTNLMDEAEQLCDRLGLLTGGRIDVVGAVGELRERFLPEEQYVVVATGVSEPLFARLRLISGIDDVSFRRRDDGAVEIMLTVQRGSQAVPEAIRALVMASGHIWSCTRRELSLDEMFRMAFGSPPATVGPVDDDRKLVGVAS